MASKETELDAIKQQYFMSGYEAGKKDATEMAKIPEEIEVKIKLSQDSLNAIADIVAYGTVGGILEAALDILADVDYELSLKLDALAKECLARFNDAENILTPELGI